MDAFVLSNYLACIARVNGKENYDKFASSGFFTIVRKDAINDTKQETLDILAQHFGLIN